MSAPRALSPEAAVRRPALGDRGRLTATGFAARLPGEWGLLREPGPAIRRGLLVAAPVGIALLFDLGFDDKLVGGVATGALLAGFIAFDAPARVRVRWQLAWAPAMAACAALGVLCSQTTATAIAGMALIGAAAAYLVAVSMRAAIAGLSCALAFLISEGLFLDLDDTLAAAAVALIGSGTQALVAGLTWIVADRETEPSTAEAGRRDVVAALRDGWGWGRAPARHAVRFGVALGVGVAIYRISGFDDHGFWVPLTILFVLKPDPDQTAARIAMRAAGTVAGLLLATLLAELLGNALIETTVALTLAAALSLALLAVEYALFTTAITVYVVLLADKLGAAPLEAAGERGLGTLLGILVAAVAFRLLRDPRRGAG